MIKTKMLKNTIKIPLIIIIFLAFIVPVRAKEEIVGYTISLEKENKLSSYISSLVLYQEDSLWILNINNKEVGRSYTPTFVYTPTLNTKITFDFSPDNDVVIKYYFNSTGIYTSEFVLNVVDGIQSVDFYPDINSNYHVTKEAKLANGFYNLGDFACTLNNKNLSFNLVIDANKDVAYITKNGVVQRYNLEKGNLVQRIFLETHVDSHLLNSNYLKSLTAKSFYRAKNTTYSTSEVTQAIHQEILTLKHQRSGLTYNTPLERVISIWTRLGQEDYDITKIRESQVVCQYNEDACSVIKNKYGQQFLVLGQSYTYDTIEKDYRYETISTNKTIYQNAHWYSSDDKTSTYWPNLNKYGVAFYRYRSGSWGDYSNYIYVNSNYCDQNPYCESKSTIKYSKSTRSYESYKQIQKSIGSIASWSSFTSGSKPSDTNYYRYRNYYKYTCKKGSKTEIKYSTSNYTINQQGPCSSGYKITSKTNGYQWAKVNWSNYSDVNSCTNITGQVKCQTITKFRLTDWSIYSGYIYDSCESSELVSCKSATKYAYRYINWNDWSDYKKTSYKQVSNKFYEVEYKYNNGILKWDDYKGNSKTLGTNAYYTGNSKLETVSHTEKIETTKVSKQTVGYLEYQTEKDILDLANEIGKQAQLVAIRNKLGSDSTIDEIETYYRNYPNEFKSVYQAAYNKFLNSNIFIPYIYVLDHYRAVYRDLQINGYQTTLSNITTITNNNTYTYTYDLIPYTKELNRDTKVIYFDTNNPFYNYDELPENWKKYEYLIEQIRNSDLKEFDITIKLTNDDIKEMEEYLDNGGNVSDCEFIKRFVHIFTKTNAEFERWLEESEGCKVGNSDS